MSALPVGVALDRELLIWLVQLDDNDSVEKATQVIADLLIGIFIPTEERQLTVRHHGRLLDPRRTLAACGVAPMDVLRVAYA